MNKKLLAVAVLAMVGATVARADIVEQILVKVNGDIFTKSDFERLQVEFLRQRPELQNVTPESPELQKAVAESTPQLILSADNSAARLLTRPGEAIYNDANGLVEGNDPFQVVWLPDFRREDYLSRIQALCRERHPAPLRGHGTGQRTAGGCASGRHLTPASNYAGLPEGAPVACCKCISRDCAAERGSGNRVIG